MSTCIKVAEFRNVEKGIVARIFLKDKWNDFEKIREWFLVSILDDGKNVYWVEKKISSDFAERLKNEVLKNKIQGNKNEIE
jgi:hypothetical protein